VETPDAGGARPGDAVLDEPVRPSEPVPAARRDPMVWPYPARESAAGTMEATVELLDGTAFRATGGSGHALTLDAPAEAGGAGRGLPPLELLLMGLGGCTGMDVIRALRRAGQDVTGYAVRVRGERRDEPPRNFRRIVVVHTLRGRGLDTDAVRRAVEAATAARCSVAAMLGAAAEIADYYVVVDEATGLETAGTHTPLHL
jgi:putative redox protein